MRDPLIKRVLFIILASYRPKQHVSFRYRPRRKRLADGLSVTQKVFVRSRNGGATKIVREHYLRSDIPCLSRSCTKCPQIVVPDAQNELPKFILSDSPLELSAPIGKHYVVLDTNVVLQAIDLLENPNCFSTSLSPRLS